MEIIVSHFNDIQPQLISIFLVTIILIVLALVIHSKVKKMKPDKAPHGITFIAEQYVMGIDNLFKSIVKEKINPVAPYIFTLLSFMMVGNIFGLVGFEPPTTSYSVPLTLGLVAWIGIFVVGIMYQKFRFFKKYINPVEIVGQFAPLISISFRLFGNMIGGSTILTLFYAFTGWMWGFIPVLGEINFFGSVLAPPLHLYFDIFDGLIQGFVFTILTVVYWTVEADHSGVVEVDEEVKKFAEEAKTARVISEV